MLKQRKCIVRNNFRPRFSILIYIEQWKRIEKNSTECGGCFDHNGSFSSVRVNVAHILTLPNSREYTNKRLTYLRSASAGICYNLSINWDIFQFNYHTRLIREQHERYKIFHFQSINWIENWLHHLTCHVPSSGVLNISQSVRYDVILWMNNEKHSMETLIQCCNVFAKITLI